MIFFIKTKCYQIKEKVLTQKQLHLMFVTLTILLMGIIFWICIIHSLVFFQCEFPDDYWLSTSIWKISLFHSFVLLTIIAFAWNLAVYVFIKETTEQKITTIFFVANLIVLIVASVILYHQNNFLTDFRIKHYQKVDGTYIVSENDWYDIGTTTCTQREKHIGQWRVIEESIDFSTDKIFTFKRNGIIKTENNQWDGWWWGFVDRKAWVNTRPNGRSLVEYQIPEGDSEFGSIDFVVEICDSGFCQIKYNRWHLELTDDIILMMQFDYYANSLTGNYVVLERDVPYQPLEFRP